MNQWQFSLLSCAAFISIFVLFLCVGAAIAIPLVKYAEQHKLDPMPGLFIGVGVLIIVAAIAVPILLERSAP